MRHRGPDWNGIACFKNCILTHERLAIVGLNSGAQPITDVDNDTAMSVNGEIYNHLELETDLKRANPNLYDAFTTDSDCEVLLHLYKTKGVDFLENTLVNGMFSFVLYDKMNDEYLVARDPIGIIPLYIGILHHNLILGKKRVEFSRYFYSGILQHQRKSSEI